MHNTWFLTFTERKDNQTSNKLNTIAIPLAATPLCMVATIVLALSLGGVIFPQILFTSLSVLIKLYYIRYTIVSSSLVEGGAHTNSFALPPPNLFGDIFYLVCCCHISFNSKTNGRKSKPPTPCE